LHSLKQLTAEFSVTCMVHVARRPQSIFRNQKPFSTFGVHHHGTGSSDGGNESVVDNSIGFLGFDSVSGRGYGTSVNNL
jgi:hypothetical protein